MPELPEVETTRLTLLPYLKGQIVAQVEVRRRDLRTPIPLDFESRLEGRRITDIRRRAKYLLFDLDNGEMVLAHLGMSGSFRVMDGVNRPKNTTNSPKVHPNKLLKKDGYLTHDHVLWRLRDGRCVVYHDPRRFGRMEMLGIHQENSHKLLINIGPEPLGAGFSPQYLRQALLKRSGPIKPALMDAKIVVGVGNIYASESLFLAGIHPAASCEIAARYSEALVNAIQTTLRAALKSGGSTLRNYSTADGDTGYFQHSFNVYNRDNYQCVVCEAKIQKLVQAGRASYFCPGCQKQSSCQLRAAKKTLQKR